MPLEELIRHAIKLRRKLAFDYKGKQRLVESFTLGRFKSGNLVLICWQFGGYSDTALVPCWRTYKVSEISPESLLIDKGEQFQAREGYVFNDPRMVEIMEQFQA